MLNRFYVDNYIIDSYLLFCFIKNNERKDKNC